MFGLRGIPYENNFVPQSDLPFQTSSEILVFLYFIAIDYLYVALQLFRRLSNSAQNNFIVVVLDRNLKGL